jgi:tripartite-type tricarboxylate transporter receptor subunit TctC
MRVLIRLSISLGCIVFGLYGPVVDAYGQTYPTKSITVVVPFPAGGPSDGVARIVTEHMSRTLRQQVVIENVGGADGTLGSARVAAQPDGYTLLAGSMDLMSPRPCLHRTSSTILNATLRQLVSPPIRPPSLWLAEIFLRKT